MPSEHRVNLAAAIITARVQAKLVQGELAARSGLPVGVITAIEAGKQSLPVESLAAIAGVLGTTVGALLGEPSSAALPASCSHDRAQDWPEAFYLGTNDLEWPLAMFGNPGHALDWLNDQPDSRHVYQVSVQVVGELRAVSPTRPDWEIVPVEQRGS